MKMVPGENTMLVPSESVSAADDPKVLCIIRDMTCAPAPPRTNLNLPATMNGQQLIEEIAKLASYEPDSFQLSYEKPDYSSGLSDEFIVNDHMHLTLAEICTNIAPNKRNNFMIMDKDGHSPIKVQTKGDSDNSATRHCSSATFIQKIPNSPGIFKIQIQKKEKKVDSVSDMNLGDTAMASVSTDNKETYSAPYLPSYASPLSYSYASALIKSDTGYVGLVNQAMTCYLNSLLQSLFMTPEFRNAVYRWEFDGTDEESTKSIPYQLQRLFLLLQTSKKRAVETTDITKSFGWDSSEAWQQHDVQELCRVMFDALEKKLKKTEQSNLINYLYQGKMKDYVKCLECGYESARLDSYLDIPLVIRPFGSNTAYGSVEEALNSFVKPEILNGNNQYFCEKCNKKCDAHKGLKFVTFPYLLTLQLMRFDFDYTTMHRIKLNDRMTFPEILNLNSHLEGLEGDVDSDTAPGDPGGQGRDGPCGRPPRDSPSGASAPTQQHEHADEGIDEGIDIGYTASGHSTSSDSSSLSSSDAAANDKNIRDSKKKGRFEYELFSIMIHSGSAAGGHYYAYIKSFTDGRWYSFNDQHVSTITYDDIKKTYGGSSTSRGYYSATYASSTNAYMLMYRQIDKDRNADFMLEEDFPAHLKRQLTLVTETEEAERKQRELDRCTCKIRIFCFHPVHQKQLESRLEVHKDKTLREATEIAWKLLELDEVVPLDCVRLVKYDEALDYVDRSYEGEEETTMSTLLGGVKGLYTFELLMEVKRLDQEFQEYKQGGVTVKVYVVDIQNESISPPVNLRAYLTQTVTEFRNIVAHAVGVPQEQMRCVRERYYNDLRLLGASGKTLKAEGFVKSNKVFIECSGTEDDTQVIFSDTKFYTLLDRFENTIRIHISLPPFVKGSECAKPIEPQCTSPCDSDQTDSSKGQSEVSEKFNDLDEGIGESEADLHGDEHDQSKRGSGPLRSSLLASGDQSGIHSAISETIHKQNLENCSGEKEFQPNDAQSDSTSTSVNTSPKESPVENSKDLFSEKESSEQWDLDDPLPDTSKDDEYRRYFTAQMSLNAETKDRTLTASVDKRITLGALKKELEPYVGITSDYFKIYRVYSNNQDCEVSRLTDSLSTYSDDSKLNVKLGRALRKGEYRVKVYQLAVNDPEPCKFLVEAIFAKQMTVLESKQIIIRELQANCDMKVPLERCRLRKKSWKNPGTVYVDSLKYDLNIPIMTNWEIFLEVLNGPERLIENNYLSVYVRRWWPSKFETGPFQEIILDSQDVDSLKDKISAVSDIPASRVEFAKARGTFPCETSLLEIQTDLDWNPQVSSINIWPLSISDDGAILYYRDKDELLMELSEEKKKSIQQKENVRLSKYSSRVTYSPRKERALKIYTDDSPEIQTNNAIPLPPTTLMTSSISPSSELD